MSSLIVKNASEKFSRLGTFKMQSRHSSGVFLFCFLLEGFNVQKEALRTRQLGGTKEWISVESLHVTKKHLKYRLYWPVLCRAYTLVSQQNKIRICKLFPIVFSTFLGPNGTRFARCHSGSKNSLNFQSPYPYQWPLLWMLPASKSFRPILFKQ
jgi:hypothetical protein